MPGMPEMSSLTWACRRLRGSSCPSSRIVITNLPYSPFDWCRELFSIICMAAGGLDTENSPSGLIQLLQLAVSRPRDALLAARSVLAGQPSVYDASRAH